jgi:hypothetical protein
MTIKPNGDGSLHSISNLLPNKIHIQSANTPHTHSKHGLLHIRQPTQQQQQQQC